MEKVVAEQLCDAAVAGWIRLDNLHLQRVVNRGGRGTAEISRMCSRGGV